MDTLRLPVLLRRFLQQTLKGLLGVGRTAVMMAEHMYWNLLLTIAFNFLIPSIKLSLQLRNMLLLVE
jgi:hypothetical protein